MMRGIVTAAAIGLMALALPAAADEVEDAAKEAMELYKKGDLAGAAGQLDYAAQLIRQQKGESLSKMLPDPLPGWTAEDASSQATGAAMFGGGVTAERTYSKGDSSMTLAVVTDSPLLQGMMAMFTNPSMMASSGAKLEKIAGQRASVQYDAASRSGEITMVLENRFLVTLRGNDVSKEDMVAQLGRLEASKFAKL
ncbi:MAG TPA: hypothetical protein VEB20_25425 [Azospirillaceae bacterium]|nr:hypothetical protein [Azospirillaceae bacterium]